MTTALAAGRLARCPIQRWQILRPIEIILDAVSVMIEKMGEELPIENILPLAKSSVFDLRKNDLFWPSFTALMSVYFNPKLNSDTMIQALDAIFEQSEFIQLLSNSM